MRIDLAVLLQPIQAESGGWLLVALTASMSFWTSSSARLLPSFLRPILSSSKVMAPLLSESMAWNMVFNPLISSSDNESAMICGDNQEESRHTFIRL